MKRQLQVLIVEDDFLIAWALAETVKSLGHAICGVAANEADAVDFACSRHPDLMIVDAGLNEGDGVSAVAAILSEQHTPCIFVTGNPEAVRASFPAASILQKPYLVPELISAIEHAVAVNAAR